MKSLLGGTIGSIVGGVVGAAIWAGLSYGLNVEIGWIAIGIGVLAGFGIRRGRHNVDGFMAGGIAVVVAVVSILAGRWVSIQYTLSDFLGDDQIAISTICEVIMSEREEAGNPATNFTSEPESIEDFFPRGIWDQAESRWNDLSLAEQDDLLELPVRANEDYLMSYLADDFVEQAMDEGRTLEWPEGKEYDTAWREADYPVEIWTATLDSWSVMSADEQADYHAEIDAFLIQEHNLEMQDIRAMGANLGFMASFNLFDILYFGLAIITAFKIGSGADEA